MLRRSALFAGALACCAGFVFARMSAAYGQPKTIAPAPDLSGRWALDKELSDDAHEKMRESMDRDRGGFGRGPGMGGPGMGGGGRLGLPPGVGGDDEPGEWMHAIFDPAEEVTVYQGQPEIVIDEKFGRRRTLHADGRKYKADNGTSEVKAEWKQGRLVVETRGFRGRKMTETWELNTTGRRLTALVKVESGFGRPATIKRVYNRASELPPPAPGAPPPSPPLTP